MKELNIAIIGQGRSGRDIHGRYLKSEANRFYRVKYVVEADEFRRKRAEEEYPGCVTLSNYTQLFSLDDVDLVVNASYSQMHYPIALDLLEHGLNVLVEKPFAETKHQCERLIKTAEEKGVALAVFQQSFFAPYYEFAKALVEEGKLGDIKQISIFFNGFARRWDWQTLIKNCAGGLYNTGPHPIGLALGFLDFDKNARVEFARLGRGMTSGDGDDYAKVILSAPGKPVIDVEVSSLDAYSPYTIKIQGSRGTYKSTVKNYDLTYITDGENPERPVIEGFLSGDNGEPIYCRENLIKHTESGEFSGDGFDVAPAKLYEQLYYRITEDKAMEVTAEMAADIIGVIAEAHARCPLNIKY